MTLEWAQNLDLCLGNGDQVWSGPLHCLGLCFGRVRIHNQILFNFNILSNQKGQGNFKKSICSMKYRILLGKATKYLEFILFFHGY